MRYKDISANWQYQEENIQNVSVLEIVKVLLPKDALVGIISLHLLIAAQLIFIWVQIRVNIRGQSEIKESIESQ